MDGPPTGAELGGRIEEQRAAHGNSLVRGEAINDIGKGSAGAKWRTGAASTSSP